MKKNKGIVSTCKDKKIDKEINDIIIAFILKNDGGTYNDVIGNEATFDWFEYMCEY